MERRTVLNSTGRYSCFSWGFRIKKQIVTILLMVVCASAWATTKTSVVTGSWSDPAIWSPAGVPTSTDDVIIHSSHTITVDGNYTCQNLNLGDATNSNATLKIIDAANSLTINGDLQINPFDKAKTYTLDAGPGAINIAGTFSYWSATGTGNIKVSTGTLTFAPTIEITAPGQNIAISNSGTVNFQNAFTDNYNSISTSNNCFINFYGTYTANTTAVKFTRGTVNFKSRSCYVTPKVDVTFYALQVDSDSKAIFNADSGAVVITNTATLVATSNLTSNIDLEFNGNWVNNGGVVNATGHTFTFNGNGKNFSGTAATTFPDLQFGKDGGNTNGYTINSDISCNNLALYHLGANNTLALSAGITLTANGNATLYQPENASTSALNINTATCSIAGNLIFDGTSDASQIAKVVVTSGSLTVGGTIQWMANTAVNTEQITVTTGSLTFGGSITMGSGSGTIIASSSTSVLNFNGATIPSLTFGAATQSPVLTINSSATVNIKAGVTINQVAFAFPSNGLVTFTGNGAITPNADITFYNVQFNGADTLKSGAGSLLVSKVITLASGSAVVLNKDLQVDGNWVNNGGTFNNPSNTVTLNGNGKTIDGTASTSFGSVKIGITANAVNSSYTILNNNTFKNIELTSSNNARTLTLNTGVSITATGNLTINQPTTVNISNILYVNGGNCSVNGNLIFAGTVSANQYAKVITTNGSFSVAGTVTWMSNTTTNTEVISVTSGTLTFGSPLTMGSGSGTLSASASGTINFNGTSSASFVFGGASPAPVFTTSAGCTLSFAKGFTNNTNSLTLNSSSNTVFTGTGTLTPSAAITFGNMQIASGATLTAAGSIYIKGNWTNEGTFTPATYTVTFNASSPAIQNITRAGGETFYKLSATTTGATIKLFGNLTVTNTLTMSHSFDLNGYTLTLGNNAGAVLTRSNGTIYGGTFKRWFPASSITATSGSYYGLFPVGTSTDYRPFTIVSTVSPTTAGYVSIVHTNALTTTGVNYTDNESNHIDVISDITDNVVTTGLAGGTFTINMYVTGLSSTGVISDMKLLTYTTSTMGSVGTTAATTGTVSNPVVKRTSVPGASLTNSWVIGSKNGTQTSLRQRFYSRKSGNWNDVTPGNGTWTYTAGGAGPSCDCIPGTTEYAVIDAGHTVTVDAASTVDFVEVAAGGILSDNGTAVLTVNKDLTLSGTGKFTNSSNWNIGRDLLFSSATQSTAAGTITITGKLYMPASGSFTQTAGSTTVNGNLDVSGTVRINNSQLNLNGTNATLYGSGVITTSGGGSVSITNHKTVLTDTRLVFGEAAHPISVDINGTATITNNAWLKIYGDLTGTTANSKYTAAANSSLEITGALLNTGTLTTTTTPNTVTYSGTSAQVIKAPAGTYDSLVIKGGGIKTLTANLTGNSSVSIMDSATLDMGTYKISGAASLAMSDNAVLSLSRSTSATYPELTGNYDISGGTIIINQTNGTSTLRGGAYKNVQLLGSRPFDLSNVTAINGNLDVQGSSNFINLPALAIGGTLNYSSSASSTLSNNISAAAVNISAGTLNDGGKNITITGSGWQQTGGTYTATGKVIFAGTAAQTIAGSQSTTFKTLQVNNANGVTVNLSPAAPANVADTLLLTSGIIHTSGSNVVRLLSTATSTAGTDSSYIDGPMVKVGNTAFTFPIGKGGALRPAGVSNMQNVTTEVTAQYFNTDQGDHTNYSGSLAQVSNLEYWDINRTVTTDSLKITLYWNSATASSIYDCSSLTIAHYTGGSWREEPALADGASICTGTGSGSITTSGYVSTFSPFGFGSNGQALPVKLVSFTADATDKGTVQTTWVTELEINNDYFTVERSADGVEFTEVGKVEGSGNSTVQRGYDFTDEKPLQGTSYYRLRQTDYDGTTSYSHIAVVNFSAAVTVNMYPNPATDVLNLEVANQTDEVQLSIYNYSGQSVFSNKYAVENGSKNIQLPLKDILTPGIYFVSIATPYNQHTEKLVVR